MVCYIPMELLSITHYTNVASSLNHLLNSDSEEVKMAKECEKRGVKYAEAGDTEAALEMFHSAISASPSWASAYNNRAQAFRLLRRDEDAMNDLHEAIKLSQGEGKAATQAYCQRAMLYQVTGKSQEAKDDWKSAADLGSQFAKNQLAQMNPYAALCNKMLYEAFNSLKGNDNFGKSCVN